VAELAGTEEHPDSVKGLDVAATVDPLVMRTVFSDRGVVNERR